MYVATINVPGYLPMDDDPPMFDSVKDAWYYLYHERQRSEDDFPCELCSGESTHGPSGDCDDDSETMTSLATLAKEGNTGSLWASTPGYDGDHDLGLFYCVSVAE